MWTIALKIFSGFMANLKLVLIAIGILIAIALAYKIYSYKSSYDKMAKENALLMEAYTSSVVINDKLVASNEAKATLIIDQEARHTEDFENQLKVYKDKLEKQKLLSNRVEQITKIERPDDEYKKCPVHPAIVYSIELLRSEASAPKSNNSN